MRKRVAVLAFFAALVGAPAAYACACCAEKDTWFQYEDAVQAGELNRVRFDRAARLFQGAAGLEGIRGIRNPRARYALTVTRTGRGWRVALGTAGALTFSLPARAEYFGVDVHDGRRSGGGGPLLYKELRMRGVAAGTGDFSGGRFTLVLMGRGNVCLNAADFTRWRLEVAGARVRYALYGTLRRAA